jgi:hypothetical protein
MITNDNKKTPKNPKFICENCDFVTGNRKDFNKHLLTAKHENNNKMITNDNKFSQKTQDHSCDNCGKVYKHRSGLSVHKKKCFEQKQNNNKKEETNELTKLVIELVKSNTELQQQMLEVCKSSTTNINTNNTNNSHNKTFNLQLYLNETCKDAMNIMDFVDSIKFQLSDLESIGELGYVNGLSKVIIRNLKALDENMRPVHCSDLRREKIYVKDDDKWEKEGADNKILKNAIKFIAHKNVKMIPEFREKYPDCIYSHSRKSDQYNRLIIEAMGGEGNDEDNKSNKIIKKIAREVLIDK